MHFTTAAVIFLSGVLCKTSRDTTQLHPSPPRYADINVKEREFIFAPNFAGFVLFWRRRIKDLFGLEGPNINKIDCEGDARGVLFPSEKQWETVENTEAWQSGGHGDASSTSSGPEEVEGTSLATPLV